MKQPSLLLTLSLSLVACISTKDVGVESDSTSDVEDATASTGSTSSDSQSSQPQTSESESDSESGVADTDTFGSTSGESFGESGIVETTGDTEGETGGFGDEQDLCESTGGIWDPGACGHYICGAQQECGALIPGCDCGVGGNFEVKVGCFPSPECKPVAFACGGDTNNCSAPGEYCEFWGASVTCLATPDECEGSYTCSCLEVAGVLDGGTCTKQDDLSLSVFVPGGP